MSWGNFGGAVLGFAAYEALRLYRWEAARFYKTGDGIDSRKFLRHLLFCAVAALLVGVLVGLYTESLATAIWIGFSAPTSLAAFLDPNGRGHLIEDAAEAMPRSRRQVTAAFFKRHFGSYGT